MGNRAHSPLYSRKNSLSESLIVSRRDTYPDLTKSSIDKFVEVQAEPSVIEYVEKFKQRVSKFLKKVNLIFLNIFNSLLICNFRLNKDTLRVRQIVIMNSPGSRTTTQKRVSKVWKESGTTI